MPPDQFLLEFLLWDASMALTAFKYGLFKDMATILESKRGGEAKMYEPFVCTTSLCLVRRGN